MHRLPVARFGLCLLMILCAGKALAQDAEPRGAYLRGLIKKFDTDGDGRLSAAERAKLREHVQGLIPQRTEKDVPATIDPRTSKLYKVAPGPLAVETVETLTLRDEKRDKDLLLRLTFPKPAGKYPVIVFSHGALGSKDAYEPLAKHWASHGYIVIQPTHGDSLALMSTDDKLKINSVKETLNSLAVIKHWNTRPQDITFVIDSLDEIEKQTPALSGKIDKTKIGVGGHSYGSHTTQMIGGLKLPNLLARQGASYQDDRPLALLMISPPGPTFGQSRADITRPTLVVTGSKDDSPQNGDPYTTRLETYKQLPTGKKYLLFLDGAHHGFGGISGRTPFPGSGPQNSDQVSCIQSASTALWDAYLKGDKQATAFLDSDMMSRETKDNAKLTKD